MCDRVAILYGYYRYVLFAEKNPSRFEQDKYITMYSVSAIFKIPLFLHLALFRKTAIIYLLYSKATIMKDVFNH